MRVVSGGVLDQSAVTTLAAAALIEDAVAIIGALIIVGAV